MQIISTILTNKRKRVGQGCTLCWNMDKKYKKNEKQKFRQLQKPVVLTTDYI